VHRLQTTDLRAIGHILQRIDVYHKPWRTQKHLGDHLGYGLLVSEGEKHRIQRKALNPAFGPGPIRDLTGIIVDKANEVRMIYPFGHIG
jgi:cytochrome P450